MCPTVASNPSRIGIAAVHPSVVCAWNVLPSENLSTSAASFSRFNGLAPPNRSSYFSQNRPDDRKTGWISLPRIPR